MKGLHTILHAESAGDLSYRELALCRGRFCLYGASASDISAFFENRQKTLISTHMHGSMRGRVNLEFCFGKVSLNDWEELDASVS